MVDYEKLLRIGKDLLIAIGENPEREGIKDTPRRFASYWKEFIERDNGNIDVDFDLIETGQLVVVSGIKVWSICEHHLLPFWCDVSIGYIPEARLLGLSKFARIAHQFAHKPQIQERLVHEIADEISRVTGTNNVIVMATGEHLCMKMRGVRSSGQMTTVSAQGALGKDPLMRAEFMRIVSQNSRVQAP
ncbi:MAG TPA: GTP cyclohydrolase I FolE [Blastocatellia bacterium]|nr:GTP cyclohydrolase I FolE [Blastocatellia bacterium]HMV83150.1 GTP cyclohydrolase I FolE [Blastocatellia bacterium]HMX24445.1 GTP cyclohydrolase I FolE [Blastocatellia bacterium]HMY74412.1 GTP cyclohydrolase I FolE [Blastocatellia bacterium]HMZ21882.1 GTP cyclohydrolase I FolE [Blastocatellia bacterium]